MARRSAGFVSKRPHKKSRGGCLTCKRKKVKCDEGQPACTYCALRQLECTYPPEPRTSSSPTSTQRYGSIDSSESLQDDLTDFNEVSLQTPSWLVPAVHTSSGQLSAIELGFMHHYKANVWPTMSFRQEEKVHALNRDWAPQMCLSKEYLLYTMLSISAAHSNAFAPDPRAKNLSLLYRQRALGAYTKALSNISSDNYETLLITSMYMMIMVPPPELPCSDAACLTWISALFNMMQGLRLLASLKWASGIEKLTVFPIFKREVRRLPPPPALSFPGHDPRFFASSRAPGDDPANPNPPQTYATPPPTPPSSSPSSGMSMENLPFRPQELMTAAVSPHCPPPWKGRPQWQLPAPAFLPPPLMALLKSLVDPPESGPLNINAPTLVPVLHALSPIFLSLYYYHLNPDLWVRIFVLPTFLTPAFLSLVAEREPRALVIVGWWFAFVRLIPNIWFLQHVVVARVMQAVSNEVMRCNDKMLMDAMEGAYRIVRILERKGREEAARCVFDGWDGVNYEEGPTKEQEWRFEELVDLG